MLELLSMDQDLTIGQSQPFFDENGQTVINFSDRDLADMVDQLMEDDFAFSPDALGMEDIEMDGFLTPQPLPQLNQENIFESQPSPGRTMEVAQPDTTTTNNGQNNFHRGGGGDHLQHQPRQDFGHPDSPSFVAPTDNRMSEVNAVDDLTEKVQHQYISSPTVDYDGNFRLIVSLQKTRVRDSNVTGEGGCVVYHPSSGQAVVEPDFKPGQARLPISTMVAKRDENGAEQLEEIAWKTERQERYTMRILNNMGGGLGLAADTSGNLYAKRQCMAKVFWTSTQRTTDEEAVELKRDEITQIFDAAAFRRECAVAVKYGTKESIRRPAIRFVFGQKWSIKSETFNAKLVTARVEPQHENDISDLHATGVGAKNHSHFDSHHSGLVCVSGEGVRSFGSVM